jgi:predicted ferric reductase
MQALSGDEMANHAQQLELERPGMNAVGELQSAMEPSSLAARSWVESRGAALLLLLAFVLLATLPPLLAFGTRRGDPLLYEVGRTSALLAFGLLALQVVLAARFRLADLALGLDTVMRLHRTVGLLALFLLLAHPALLLLATHGTIGLGWQVALGAGALLVLVVGVLAALLFRFLHVDYNRWRVIHKGMILAVVLAYVHSRGIGKDILSSGGLRAWSTSLLAMAVGIFVWRNVYVPRWGRRRSRVESVTAEVQGIWTIRFSMEDGRPLGHRPGQFMFLSLLRSGLPTEEHPFTISSSPCQARFFTTTIKESGNYTRTIGLTRAGDRALVEGPFGRFSLVHHDAERFLFISAGVGSTPIVSMLRFLRDTADPRPALFLCVNRTEADIPFREELDRLPTNMEVVHVLSRAGASWRGARGHLDEATLRDIAGASLTGATVYLCGPTAFMVELRRSLRRLGVRRARIHVERFAVP